MALSDSKLESPLHKPTLIRVLRKRVFLLRSPWLDYLLYTLLIIVFVKVASWAANEAGYYWQWYLIPKYIYTIKDGHFVAGPILEGLGFTLQFSAICLVLSLAVGLSVALIRQSSSVLGRFGARVYLEVIRGTPALVQIYLWYFVLGPIIGLGRYPSAVVAIVCFSASYMSEIFRAGIVSIGTGQWQAAHSLGLSIFDTYRDIILPQAIRRILPPLTGQVITLIKTSALISLVGIGDLTQNSRVVAYRTFMVFEVWFTVAAIYLLLTIPLSTIANYMEKRFRILT
ncbi:MAG: amino acid ABC transporter permease [Anaerolineales bacterium]|nr:amino acid ABC transporter permease [Anaerolineales bacterium]